MPVTAQSILEDLQQNKYSPLYFLFGEEAFFIDQIADYIEENALSEADKGFNQTVVYGKDVSVKAVLESARRYPMFAQKQVMIVKEAQEISDIGRKTGQDQLVTYAKTPVETTVLVFCYKHKKLDGRTELYKVLKKHAILFQSAKLYDNKIPGWMQQYTKERGVKINARAVQMLAEYVGNNLSGIANALDKILLNFDKEKEITETIVAENVGLSKEFNAFELQNALGNRNVFKSNQIINYFESNPKNNPIIPIISLLFSYFSKILLVHQHRNTPQNELAKLLGVNPFFVKDYQTASRNYPISKTVQVIHHIQEADLRSKGVNSIASDYQVLKELVFKILN